MPLRRHTTRRPSALAGLLCLTIAACGTSTDDAGFTVGCTTNAQCSTGRCQTGGSFPGGLCTRACTSNAGCPAGWSCISNSSGICMRTCSVSADCASLDARYVCSEESLEGSSSGRARVCKGP